MKDMDKFFMAGNSIKEFKRKRKSTVQAYRFEESCGDEDIKPAKRIMTEDNFANSLNSLTAYSNNKYQELETSSNGISSDESELNINLNSFHSRKNYNINGLRNIKTEKIKEEWGVKSIYSENQDFTSTTAIDPYSQMSTSEKSTFRVDMSRFNCFNISAAASPNVNSLKSMSDFKGSMDSPSYLVSQSLPTPPRTQNSQPVARFTKNRSHIYKPHRHNKNVPVSYVPCKGPACTSQICCAHFCSQRCFNNQKWPIGVSGNFKKSIPDYDSSGQTEINVTDYGLPYPDHTYCRDHKDIYFCSDPNIDCPPYFDLVETIFYEEKESRIKNPIPIPNFNGDPISSSGYVSHTTKRGRPKRSNVVGLLNSYIFHPSSEVIYTPFIFKESIIEADRSSNETKNQDPIIYALRQCSSLYKDVRPDIPREVLYGTHSKEQSDIFEDMIKQECSSDLTAIDDIFGSVVVDDFSFK